MFTCVVGIEMIIHVHRIPRCLVPVHVQFGGLCSAANNRTCMVGINVLDLARRHVFAFFLVAVVDACCYTIAREVPQADSPIPIFHHLPTRGLEEHVGGVLVRSRSVEVNPMPAASFGQ